MNYSAPIKAKAFLMKYAADLNDIMALPAFNHASEELVTDILSGAASFSEDILAPINRNGDLNPATIENGNVTASPGFKEAYSEFVAAGWMSLPASEDIGGAGLPATLSVAVNEMIYACLLYTSPSPRDA